MAARGGVMPSQRENLSRNKEMVLAAMKSKGHTNRFKAFCKSETMDAFLHACIDYFLVFFKLIEEKEKAKNSAERRDALAEGKAPPSDGGASPSDAANAPLAPPPSSREIFELEEEQRSRLKDVALVYATILLKHSNYSNTQQERQFFESLYDFAKRVLFTINQRKNWHAIENELDRVFRSPHFNLSQRKNDQNLKGGATQNQSYKEMFEKRGSLEQPMGRSHRSSIHQALMMRSPIISEIFPTPEERFEREKQRKEQEEAQALEEGGDPSGGGGSDLGWGGGGGGSGGDYLSSAGSKMPRGGSRDAVSSGGGREELDGEEAMERIVQEAAAEFDETLNR